MIRKCFGVVALVIIATALLTSASCARNQQLVGITVTPATVTFEGVGAQLQFTAIGTYIHPAENKNVTNQATWTVDSQNLLTFGAPGFVTAVSDCGTGNVTATINDGGNLVFGSAFVSGAGVGTNACTQAALTVVISGSGTVVSAPAGINCPGTCSASFPLDAGIQLTGTPGTGLTTVIWTWPAGTVGCTSTTATTCNLPLDTSQTITATFQ